MKTEILKVVNLTKRFGGLTANSQVNLTAGEGEILGLLGPNGAGKTTLFNCIAGYYRADEGSVTFRGEDITSQSPEDICRSGIARTFQLVKVFNGMTVLENVMCGAFLRSYRVRKARSKAQEVIDFLELSDKVHIPAENLTLPDKKRLELARALALDPRLIMLDEVMAGLTTAEIGKAVETLSRICDMGITLVVVEHVMEAIMPIAHKVVVLDNGEKIAEGTPDVISSDPRVIKAYLGEKYVAARRQNQS